LNDQQAAVQCAVISAAVSGLLMLVVVVAMLGRGGINSVRWLIDWSATLQSAFKSIALPSYAHLQSAFSA